MLRTTSQNSKKNQPNFRPVLDGRGSNAAGPIPLSDESEAHGQLDRAIKDFTEELKMRRWLLAAMLLGCLTASGCAIPIYSALPERRAEQLIYTSENLRLLIQEWERFWFLDQPDHMTPYRVHGGVI